MAKKRFEQWKPIDGFDGIYRISNHGRVKVKACIRITTAGIRRHFGAKELRSSPKKGYPWVILCHPLTRERRWVPIHILVAETFLGPKPTPKHEVNHRDGDKKNPHIDNLEWVTPSENNKHSWDIGLRISRLVTFNGKSKRLADWAREFNMRPQTIYGRFKVGTPVDVLFDQGLKYKQYRGHKISVGHLTRKTKYKNGLRSQIWADKLGISRAAFLWRVKYYAGRDELIYHTGPFPRRGPTKEK